MPKKTLAELNKGRDPQIMAQNVRRRRNEMGLTKQKLAEIAGISCKTVAQIENGLGCTPTVELKLNKALGMWVGSLWIPRSPGMKYLLRSSENCRWIFSGVTEGLKYVAAHNLWDDEKHPHISPETIQDQAERYRLGQAGLSTAFVKVASMALSNHNIACGLYEQFGTTRCQLMPGAVMHFHCIKGSLLIVVEQESLELHENDSFGIERDVYFEISPHPSVTPKELPVLYYMVMI
jgi:DNA-binding XRE family transcriptional regulator